MIIAASCPPMGYDLTMYFIAAFGFASIIAGWGFFANTLEDKKNAYKLWMQIFAFVFVLAITVERLNQVDCAPF